MRRLLSKLVKPLLSVVLYAIAYNMIVPDTGVVRISLVSDKFSIGEKYVLLFLVAPHLPTLSDAEGARVFTARDCQKCFVTNNKGFSPMRQYDAILVLGGGSELSKTAGSVNPSEWYQMETSEQCVVDKLQGCEPKITSNSTKESYGLCGLCDMLHKKRSVT